MNETRVSEKIYHHYKCFSIQSKVAFFSSIVFGILAHLYMFMNKLPNYDDMGLNRFGATFRLGRWFLWLIGATLYHLDFVYSIPWVNGLCTLFFIALSTAMIIKILDIKNLLIIVLISGVLVTFPSWTATFFFMFTVHYYALALLMGTVAVYLTCKYKKGIWISGVILACSLGIYQAYLPFIASLFVLVLLKKSFCEDISIQTFLLTGVKYLAALLYGAGLYYMLVRITLAITNQELASYRGVGDSDLILVQTIILGIKRAGINCFGMVVNNNLEISYNLCLKLVYFIAFMVTGILLGMRMREYGKAHNRINMVTLLVSAFLFLIAVNSIFIIFPKEDAVYSLMVYSYVLYLVIPLCLTDWAFRQGMVRQHGKCLACIESCIVLTMGFGCFNYIHFANGQYISLQLSLNQAKSYYTTLITQIKSVDGYRDDLPVTFIGGRIEDLSLYRNDVMDVYDISGRDDSMVDVYTRNLFLAYYCGFQPQYVDESNIIDQELVVQMPSYPNEGSIQILNDIIVIKLAEN